MQESGQKLHRIIEAPYERRVWPHDSLESEDDIDQLGIRLDMELIWSLLRAIVDHARGLVKKEDLSTEEELFLKVQYQ